MKKKLKQNDGRTDESIWTLKDKIGMGVSVGFLLYFFAIGVVAVLKAKGWM